MLSRASHSLTNCSIQSAGRAGWKPAVRKLRAKRSRIVISKLLKMMTRSLEFRVSRSPSFRSPAPPVMKLLGAEILWIAQGEK